MTRVRMVASFALVASVVLVAPGGSALASGAPAAHEVLTTCTTTPTAQLASSPDGLVRGFVATGCAGETIDYVVGDPVRNRWAVRATPYRGQVLATTEDTQAAYLLYRAADGVRVTKVLRDGTATHGNLLSPAAGGGLEGTIAARGGGWYAVWTEPKPGGGFAMHAAASRNYVISPKDRIEPAGAGVDDSAPAIAKGPGTDPRTAFLLAWARHTASGYHLEVAHFGRPWPPGRVLDQGMDNPAPAITATRTLTWLAWSHGHGVRLATTQGSGSAVVALHEVTPPQAPGSAPAGASRVAYGCGRLSLAFVVGGENAGRVYLDSWSGGRWVQRLVRDDRLSAPVLAGLSVGCSATTLVWTEAGRVLAASVS